MKRLFAYFFIVLVVVFFTACQKELQFDAIPDDGLALGTLKSSSDNCLPSSVSGDYTKDTILKSTNFVEVTIDVTKIGNYTIKTDTIAGMSFSAIGTVNALGLNIVKLIGVGTPTSTGTKIFTVKFGNSICRIFVPVVSGANPNSIYTLGGAPGNCSGVTSGIGIYTAGTTVGATHTVTLSATVTNPGIYTLNTGASINGLSFSGTGSFAANGIFPVVLTATGTPTVAGSFNYTASNGTSSCTFTITVIAAPPVPNLDYIPQTSFTNWTTRLVGGTLADTTFIQVSANSRTFGTNTYKIFERKVLGNPTDSFFNRKNGGLYYQYIDGNLGVLDNSINKEYLVLDSTKLVAQNWTSNNLGPNSAMGFIITDIRIKATIIAKGATFTVNGITYTNVIEVDYAYEVTILGLGNLPIANEKRRYAKGIGVIYSSIQNLIAPATIQNELTRSQIF